MNCFKIDEEREVLSVFAVYIINRNVILSLSNEARLTKRKIQTASAETYSKLYFFLNFRYSSAKVCLYDGPLDF